MAFNTSALVSIIVPIYNVQSYVERCIQSLLQQEHRNIEIILIDDGSTDDSGKICDQYTGDRRIIVIHQKNGGVSKARNKGLSLMHGDYVAFVDSDNFVSPYFISHALAEIQRKEADIVVFDFLHVKNQIKSYPIPDLHKKYEFELMSGDDEIKKLILTDSIPNYMWNKLYKSKLWRNLVFPEKYTYEDLFIWPELINKAKTITYLPESLYYYNQDNLNSLSSAKASLNSFNRYCHFKGLQSHLKILENCFMEGDLEYIIIGKTLKEAIEAIVTEFGNPSLTQSEMDEIIYFISSKRNLIGRKIGFKSAIIAWIVCYCLPIVKIYGKYRYRHKLKKCGVRR